MDRFFEKISFKQFKKDIENNRKLYDEYELPYRSSKNSCGYDFIAIKDYIIKPGEILKIPTGYKFKCKNDEFLMIVVRSSMGFKYNVRMCNQVGIIDSDFYNNVDNEGHMWVCLQNEGNKDFVINKGDKYCQGIFVKYFTCGDEVDDIRVGGLGSTNKESD
ncbi:MAG: deoxyuridine 5'-triphosphate nucleotidohydrolase [Bacilli bacterium]|nr:deoxyuridine 5'-triphosphate nucleotidohydrolase [Bacilli bacterium]